MTTIEDMLYLDPMATAPMLSCAMEAMWPWMQQHFANPSSPHSAGRHARAALEQARTRIADILSCHAEELIFTSGGSEANHLAVRGITLAAIAAGRAPRIITTPLEHASTRGACDYLARWHGVQVDEVAVDHHGRVDLDALRHCLRLPAALCSIVLAHPEIGTLQDACALAALTASAGVALHLDAVQSLSWQPSALSAWPIAAMSFSGHKLGAGRGVGALYLRKGTPLEPLLPGGHQEGGRRGGTEALPHIIALASALAHVQTHQWPQATALAGRSEHLIACVLEQCPQARLTGHRTCRLPGHASFVFPGLHCDAVRQALEVQGILCSSVSACQSAVNTPSPALLALGLSPQSAESALRLGLDLSLDDDAIVLLAQQIAAAVKDVARLCRPAC